LTHGYCHESAHDCPLALRLGLSEWGERFEGPLIDEQGLKQSKAIITKQFWIRESC
jgi:hypothetical protein